MPQHGRGGRLPVAIIPHKRFILDRLYSGISYDQVLSDLRTQRNFTVSKPTLKRYLSLWPEYQSRISRTVDTTELRLRIQVLFSSYGFHDQVILETLQREGYIVSLDGLKRIRKELGLVR